MMGRNGCSLCSLCSETATLFGSYGIVMKKAVQSSRIVNI